MRRFHLSFSWQLFALVAVLFVSFSAFFVFFQYSREREFKIELLNNRLQDFNNEFSRFLSANSSADRLPQGQKMASYIRQYMGAHHMRSLRVTVISAKGKVLYDNDEPNVSLMQNHLNRSEVRQALLQGSGYAINRVSHTLSANFFYSASFFPASQLVVRSALPYDVSLSSSLRVDSLFIYFAVVVCLLLFLIFLWGTRRMRAYIVELRSFVSKADRGEPVEPEEISSFPDNDFGEISRHIVQIYKDLSQAKFCLQVDREKLIAHLSIAREGLCIFSAQGTAILSNSLFAQFSNLISDSPLSSNEGTLCLPEFLPVHSFLQQPHSFSSGTDFSPANRLSFSIEKNGKIFKVECAVFPDASFEVMINDVTEVEKHSRLKHQLTQNIAHELKTPVCSIQGYLETILSTPDMSAEVRQQFLSRSFAQSNRLANLLRDITLLTRIDEAQSLFLKEPVDVSLMVQNIQREVALQLQEKAIRVNNLLPPGLSVMGNSSLIYSIFRNLTDNAIAYAGQGATISIRCFRQESDFFYFSFADNGVGVAPEHLARLFERFYRVDKGRSRKMGGTGLGLAIVKNAVLFHEGQISAKNALGGGLEVVFNLHR